MRTHVSRLAAIVAGAAALAAAPAAHAQPGMPPMPPSVRVSASGEVHAAPDKAVADFAVETAGASAQAAASQNAAAMERVIAALVRAGVPRDRIETRDYNVYPEYEQRTGDVTGEPRIRGYRVTNTVTATTYEIDKVGGIIDAALGAGANRVNGVRFGLRDPQRFRQQAIADAVRRARADADALAGALGVRIEGIREAETTDFTVVEPPVLYQRAAMADMAASAPTPINPGDQVVRATVTVTYAIAQ